MRVKWLTGFLAIAVFFLTARAQTTAFTYQGSLKDGTSAATGNYDFEFALFDAVSGGNQIGSTLSRNTVAVANGIFAVSLDFGGLFPGANRFLEIRVRLTGGGALTTLAPRQPVGSAPYSVKSLNADTAANATQLGGLSSGSFIQNGTSQQAGTNFNISGNGTAGGTLSAGTVNAATQYNLNGLRVLSVPFSTTNFFAGVSAGSANTTGQQNSFFGGGAGQSNTTGGSNAFFGSGAGAQNTTAMHNSFFGNFAGVATTLGSDNAFFGFEAGELNTQGIINSFFGSGSGAANTTGSGNSFFGYGSGAANTTGGPNSFFGNEAGAVNTTGNSNSFFGAVAAGSNTSGSSNAFFGTGSGPTNTTGDHNTLIGTEADTSTGNLSFATAIGAGAIVGASNTIQLGRSVGTDTVDVPGKLQIDTLGTAGSTSLCLNASNRVGTCSSSLRYKTNIGVFRSGLSLVRRLHPITFDWKDGGMHDLGLGAEDVAKIDPLLVTYNAKGDVEGVKYDRIGVVLVNAVNEQQSQIDEQRSQITEQKKTIDRQQTEINELKQIVCELKPSAKKCSQR